MVSKDSAQVRNRRQVKSLTCLRFLSILTIYADWIENKLLIHLTGYIRPVFWRTFKTSFSCKTKCIKRHTFWRTELNMKNTPRECAKTSAFTFGACHFYLICSGSSREMRPVYYCAIMMTFNLFANWPLFSSYRSITAIPSCVALCRAAALQHHFTISPRLL